MHEFSLNQIVGSEFWVNSSDLTFNEIQEKSFLQYEYRNFLPFTNEFEDSLLSPINGYAKDFSPIPEILDVTGNTVRFRQRTHAEIWVEPRVSGLYALDKCHQRQFYPSGSSMSHGDCFPSNYKFYTPWILETKNKVSFFSVVDEFSPFVINEKIFNNTQINKTQYYMTEPLFIDFLIKKEGNHMHSDKYGIIEIGTPMYDFSVTLNEEEMLKVNV
jgi:hypothetical protein